MTFSFRKICKYAKVFVNLRMIFAGCNSVAQMERGSIKATSALASPHHKRLSVCVGGPEFRITKITKIHNNYAN